MCIELKKKKRLHCVVALLSQMLLVMSMSMTCLPVWLVSPVVCCCCFFLALIATCPPVRVCLLLQAMLPSSLCSSWLFLVFSVTNKKGEPGLHATRLLRLLRVTVPGQNLGRVHLSILGGTPSILHAMQ